MKAILSLFLILCSAAKISAQEIKGCEWVYPDSIIGSFKNFVDSLATEFKLLKHKPDYYPVSQWRGNYVSVVGNKAKEAVHAIKSGATYNEIAARFHEFKIDTNLFVVSQPYKDTTGKVYNSLRSLNIAGEKYSIKEDKTSKIQAIKVQGGEWFFKYYKSPQRNKVWADAFFVEEQLFGKSQLPEKYADIFRYIVSAVDTSKSVFKMDYDEVPEYRIGDNVDSFLRYVNRETRRPIYREETNELFFEIGYRSWLQEKYSFIKTTLLETEKFKNLFAAAFKEVQKDADVSCDEFDEYIEVFVSPEKAFEIKSRRHHNWSCHSELCEIIHYSELARLAAINKKWSVFLKYNLMLVGEEPARWVDLDYDQRDSCFLINILERTNLNMQSLLLGKLLCAANLNMPDYTSFPEDLERAIDKSHNRSSYEKEILAMLEDTSLDYYNRLMLWIWFKEYLASTDFRCSNNYSLMKVRCDEIGRNFPQFLQLPIQRITRINYRSNRCN